MASYSADDVYESAASIMAIRYLKRRQGMAVKVEETTTQRRELKMTAMSESYGDAKTVTRRQLTV